MYVKICPRCGNTTDDGDLFCSEGCKEVHGDRPTHVCYYCGVPCNTIDHVPPQSVRTTLLEYKIDKWPFVEVDACQECNSVLGARKPWDLDGRKLKIKKFIKRRYAPQLAQADWTDEEIAELGRGLSDFVTETHVMASWARARVKW